MAFFLLDSFVSMLMCIPILLIVDCDHLNISFLRIQVDWSGISLIFSYNCTGRTGRARSGRVVILSTEGLEERVDTKGQEKTRSMYRNLKRIVDTAASQAQTHMTRYLSSSTYTSSHLPEPPQFGESISLFFVEVKGGKEQ